MQRQNVESTLRIVEREGRRESVLESAQLTPEQMQTLKDKCLDEDFESLPLEQLLDEGNVV